MVFCDDQSEFDVTLGRLDLLPSKAGLRCVDLLAIKDGGSSFKLIDITKFMAMPDKATLFR